MLKRIFAPGRDSGLTSFALLVSRLWLGLTMLILHGIPKITGFEQMKEKFPELFGMSPVMGLALAVFAEVFCSFLLALGLLTRFSALALSFTMGVAYGVAHQFALTGKSSGEMAYIYLAGFVVLLIAGPGRFSLDQLLFGGSSAASQPK